MKLYIYIFAAFAAVSCGGTTAGDAGQSESDAEKQSVASVEIIEAVSPTGDKFKQGDAVELGYTIKDGAAADSVLLVINGRNIGSIDGKYILNTSKEMPVGQHIFRITAYSGGEKHTKVGQFMLFAADSPKRYGYKIEATYPHDKNAYTQGLFYHDGFLYEGTGQKGQSSLRKVEIASGKIAQKHDLDRKYFGEGIVLLDGKIYQLTWEHNKGFVYDAATFKPLSEFGYPTEGWGITTDGKNLYVSDGTEKITIYSPDGFRKTGEISVYTDKIKVNMLNELEWIDGKIWANIYTSDDIVIIDPATGVAEGVIDCRGLLSEADREPNTDVLNGIAYDPADKAVYLTGKNWSKLFRISLK